MRHRNPTLRLAHEVEIKAGAFTLVELLATITIIAILAALLMAVISKGKVEAKRAVCLSNQKQLVSALMMYADNDSGHSFGGTKDRRQFYPFVDENWLRINENLPAMIFFCPGTRNGTQVEKSRKRDGTYIDLMMPAQGATSIKNYSYDILLWFADMEDYWNGNPDSNQNSRFVIKTQSNIENYVHANEAFGMKGKCFGASRIWLLTDNDAISPNKFWPDPNNNHGTAGDNTAFADGHVEWIPRSKYVYVYEASQDNNRTRATLRPRL